MRQVEAEARHFAHLLMALRPDFDWFGEYFSRSERGRKAFLSHVRAGVIDADTAARRLDEQDAWHAQELRRLPSLLIATLRKS